MQAQHTVRMVPIAAAMMAMLCALGSAPAVALSVLNDASKGHQHGTDGTSSLEHRRFDEVSMNSRMGATGVERFLGAWVGTSRSPVFIQPKTDSKRFYRTPPRSVRIPVLGRRSRHSSGAGGVICLVFFGLIVAAVIFLFGAVSKRQTAESYRQLAVRHGGTCDEGGWFDRPKVLFTYAGAVVIIDVSSSGGENPAYYTQVHFHGLQPNMRCEVYPAGMWSRVSKLMGMEDIEIGSPLFDEMYVIKGSDRSALRDLLTPAVQQQIEQLRRFLGNRNIYISLNSQELLVKKLSYIRDSSVLERFTELAIGLYDQVAVTVEKGIEFVEQTQPPDATEIICQVCGDPVTSDQVICRGCKTPHHQDCWEYYGVCSTYGCGEKRYLRSKS